MLNKDSKEILQENYFLNKVHDGRKKIKFDKDGSKVLVFAYIVSLVVITYLYLISPFSKTINVTINGNVYLKKDAILSKANINEHFLLTMPSKIKERLENDPLIEEVTITMLDERNVVLDIKEVKEIGYIFEDNKSLLLLVNDDRVELTKDNMYLINKVPLIEGYSKDELKKIEKGFEAVDYKTINEISEIHKYPVSYDNEQMEVIMRDGNYCFLSSSSLKLLENYYSISSAIDREEGYACAYFDDLTNSAYISTCPWQIVDEEEKENSEITNEEDIEAKDEE